ncbi:YpmS family protein [Furfurilactobacillus sp. WILCCON 0119]|uniref:YpmS family protein n=1 Tax=Furfurilactobacillus entadae TaxID=2922307 RepID=UPI0035EA18AA
MADSQTRTTAKPRRPKNGWKIVALSLIGLLVAVGLWVGIEATQPVDQPVAATKKAAASNATFQVQLNTKQVNALADYYINQTKHNEYNYKFVINKNAMLYGTTKFLGANITYGLIMEPSVTKDGNIKLRATRMAVGRLQLPVHFVMTFVAKNYKFPKGISADAKTDTVLIDLSKVGSKRSLNLQAETLDVNSGTYVFKAGIPQAQFDKEVK